MKYLSALHVQAEESYSENDEVTCLNSLSWYVEMQVCPPLVGSAARVLPSAMQTASVLPKGLIAPLETNFVRLLYGWGND